MIACSWRLSGHAITRCHSWTKEGEVFPMVSVGDFTLEDNIFPGTPGDSLLYTSKELDKL